MPPLRYNLTGFFHDTLGADYFFLHMPLVGPNHVPGGPGAHVWFKQWEAKGDKAPRFPSSQKACQGRS